ncbi:diguanylate cyclase [Bifidobacterium sp. DSM 109960]|uniref:Diguanylate cyclase n=1 Tax=Bifidobacterium erythrocebi TaxID=2675325 RepID=A0A7Y0ESQ1_9BIFI|nr:ABC transporter ATP-binding protein [Bifidobacterium sp. DSM 109960]NMM95720.1 diguanylate cyclase [Bifidobacterium sp. DSM 109960]
MSIEIRDLDITVGSKRIVHDVSMDIADGERVGLIGSSGSGKSMIAKAVMGLLPETARVGGSIVAGGKQLVGLDDTAMADLRGRYMGMVFQNPAAALNPVMTVAQQVGLPLYLHYDLSLDERVERVKAMLDKVGLPQDALLKYPHELSGGQQQRVGIATALITSPKFIIADEPTTALDSITQRQIVDLLTSLVDGAGASMLFITHDFAVLSRATTRCYVLDGGAIAESGRTADILHDPQGEPARRLVGAARMLTLRRDAEVSTRGFSGVTAAERSHDDE